MASSSLAAQLKQIAGPRVPGIAKGKASLLFDKKQAADIDVDTLYSIGQTALADLSTQNPAFKDFEETLFSDRLKSFDRTLQVRSPFEEAI